MKIPRRLLAFVVLATSVGGMSWVGCSQKNELGTQGTPCDTDPQCAAPLVCKCVVLRNPDEEGPDEIVKHGTCQPVGTKCANTDAGPRDSSADTRLDEADVTDVSDIADAAETSDASDAVDAVDASDSTEAGDSLDEAAADGG